MLTPPSTDDLLIHMRRTDPFDTNEEEWAEDSLQRATDLAQIATGVEDDPTDELAARIMQVGVLAMGHAIFVSSLDRDELYSPFSSERIGSYSYSKAQQAVSASAATGVPEFDQMVRYFAGLETESPAIGVTSEAVFVTPREDAEIYVADPLGSWF
jgi:hypothetical protein